MTIRRAIASILIQVIFWTLFLAAFGGGFSGFTAPTPWMYNFLCAVAMVVSMNQDNILDIRNHRNIISINFMQLLDNQQRTIHITPLDVKGKATSASKIIFGTSNPAVFTVIPGSDGTSAAVVAQGIGVANLSVTVYNTDKTQTVTQVSIQVVSSDAISVEQEWDDAIVQPTLVPPAVEPVPVVVVSSSSAGLMEKVVAAVTGSSSSSSAVPVVVEPTPSIVEPVVVKQVGVVSEPAPVLASAGETPAEITHSSSSAHSLEPLD
jgi:hypothetical protein